MRIVLYTAVTFVCCAILLLSIPRDLAHWVIVEDGPVESTTAVLYAVLALLAWVLSVRRVWSLGYSASVILFVFALRELDVNKRFTTMNTTRATFYYSPDVPVIEKIIAAVLLLCIAVVVFRFLWRNFRGFSAAVRRGQNSAIVLLAAIVVSVVSRIGDKVPAILEDLQLSATDNFQLAVKIVEEVGELFAAILIALAMFIYSKNELSAKTSLSARSD